MDTAFTDFCYLVNIIYLQSLLPSNTFIDNFQVKKYWLLEGCNPGSRAWIFVWGKNRQAGAPQCFPLGGLLPFIVTSRIIKDWSLSWSSSSSSSLPASLAVSTTHWELFHSFPKRWDNRLLLQRKMDSHVQIEMNPGSILVGENSKLPIAIVEVVVHCLPTWFSAEFPTRRMKATFCFSSSFPNSRVLNLGTVGTVEVESTVGSYRMYPGKAKADGRSSRNKQWKYTCFASKNNAKVGRSMFFPNSSVFFWKIEKNGKKGDLQYPFRALIRHWPPTRLPQLSSKCWILFNPRAEAASAGFPPCVFTSNENGSPGCVMSQRWDWGIQTLVSAAHQPKATTWVPCRGQCCAWQVFGVILEGEKVVEEYIFLGGRVLEGCIYICIYCSYMDIQKRYKKIM